MTVIIMRNTFTLLRVSHLLLSPVLENLPRRIIHSRYDYFVIPVLSLSFFPQKFTTTILLNHDLVYAIPSINSWSEAFVQSSKSPPHLPNKMNINRRADLSSCAHVMHSVMACRWKFISSPSHATLERSPVSPTIRIKRCDSLQLILRKGRSRKSLGNSVPG